MNFFDYIRQEMQNSHEVAKAAVKLSHMLRHIDLDGFQKILRGGLMKKAATPDAWDEEDERRVLELQYMISFATIYREAITHQGDKGECDLHRERTASDDPVT